MKNTVFILKKMLFLLLLLGISMPVQAQKPDDVQKNSLWPKSTVKVDGKLNEWGDTLMAYNKTIKFWYTIANDYKNIYLAIKSTGQAVNSKIMAGGISFTINTAGKKKDKDAFVVTYPFIEQATGRDAGRRRRGFGQQQDEPDSAAIAAQLKSTLATVKEISVIGFKDITDTVISIYNIYGIKAAANFDNKGHFVYELSIPLSLLGLAADGKTEIAYDIKVNGLQMGGFGGGNPSRANAGGYGGNSNGGGDGGGFGNNGAAAFGGKHTASINDLTSPDDFWAKYVIAANTP